MSSSNRKFLTEFMYLATVHVDYIGRPQQLPELLAADFERPPHLYLITSQPVMTADPDTLQIDDEFIRGTIRIMNRNAFSEYEFRSPHPFGADATIQSPWPHEEFLVYNSTGEHLGGGVVANLGLTSTLRVPIPALEHKVLYVGQAYGKDGERIAPDRLVAHSTLQRILAECPRDRQIWLMLASLSDENFLAEIDAAATASATNDEDNEHISRLAEAIADPPFDRSIAVSLAEAGLIRYFQPYYNKVFKDAFPGPQHRLLEVLRDLDLLALITELQSHNIPVLLSSDQVPAHYYHEAKYYIHLDGSDRRSDWAMRDWLSPDKSDTE